MISKEVLDQAYDYQSYRKLIDDLLIEGKTTGANQSGAYINYARMSQKRMQKWEKIGKLNFELTERLKDVKKPLTLFVITEGWCGDAGQILPFVAKMAEENSLISLKFILRDEHPKIMDRFLTNGARSIPIIIGLTESREVLGQWGPRPEPIQIEFLENKISNEKTGQEFSEYMHLWYAKDKGVTFLNEFLAILDVWIQKLQSLPVQAG